MYTGMTFYHFHPNFKTCKTLKKRTPASSQAKRYWGIIQLTLVLLTLRNLCTSAFLSLQNSLGQAHLRKKRLLKVLYKVTDLSSNFATSTSGQRELTSMLWPNGSGRSLCLDSHHFNYHSQFISYVRSKQFWQMKVMFSHPVTLSNVVPDTLCTTREGSSQQIQQCIKTGSEADEWPCTDAQPCPAPPRR